MLRKLKERLKPAYVWLLLALPPKTRVIFGYFIHHGRLPDLENPQTFNEKIIWRKLYDRDPRLPELVDKIRAKEWIAARYGPELVIPTLAAYATPAEMDFTKPPLSNPPYVIKTNHSCGANIYINSEEDCVAVGDIRDRLASYMSHNHGAVRGEWAYEEVEPKILVEPYIKTPAGYLADYKFHVCAGRVFLVDVVLDRYKNAMFSHYDRDWNRLDLVWNGPKYPENVPKPAAYDTMLKLAESIGRDFSYVRVDLYEVDGAVKFGELTFYPGAGHDRLTPREWDDTFGALWKLPLTGTP